MTYTIRQFSYDLHRFLFSNKCLELLSQAPYNGCGWLDGGCLALAYALRVWFGMPTVEMVQINWYGGLGDHALIKIGQWYLDGDGVSTEQQLVDRWINFELREGAYITEFNPGDFRNTPVTVGPMRKLPVLLNARFNRAQVWALLQE